VHARSGPFHGLVVPAPLIAAVVAGLGAIDVPIPHTVALVGWNWKFEAPVRPGDSILSRWRLNRKRDVEDARLGLVTWQVEVENQKGELVAMADVVRLVARRQGTELPEPAEADEATGGEVAGDQVRGGRRRRRRRGGGNGGLPPESVAAQPAPDAVAVQPAPDAVAAPDAVPAPDAVAAPDAVPATAPRVAEVLPLVEPQAGGPAGVPEGATPPLEPAAAPSRRRRRRRGNGNGGPAPEAQPEVQPEEAETQRPQPDPGLPASEPTAPAGAPEEPAAKPRRPRRRRTPPPPEPVIGSPFRSSLGPGLEQDHEPPAQG
jgi:hypothetical protein